MFASAARNRVSHKTDAEGSVLFIGYPTAPRNGRADAVQDAWRRAVRDENSDYMKRSLQDLNSGAKVMLVLA
jgi:hypothetical protein